MVTVATRQLYLYKACIVICCKRELLLVPYKSKNMVMVMTYLVFNVLRRHAITQEAVSKASAFSRPFMLEELEHSQRLMPSACTVDLVDSFR